MPKDRHFSVEQNEDIAVGLIEALSRPSNPAHRLLEMTKTWPEQSPDVPFDLHKQYRTARQLRPAEIDQLVAAYRTGSTVYELAARLGIHRVTVGRHLRNRGIDTTPPGLDPADVPAVAELYRSGWALAKIAKKFDTSADTVRTRLLETGVKIRTPWER